MSDRRLVGGERWIEKHLSIRRGRRVRPEQPNAGAVDSGDDHILAVDVGHEEVRINLLRGRIGTANEPDENQE
jgi:hypothetical protein